MFACAKGAAKIRQKDEKHNFFEKSYANVWRFREKLLPLHPLSRETRNSDCE